MLRFSYSHSSFVFLLQQRTHKPSQHGHFEIFDQYYRYLQHRLLLKRFLAISDIFWGFCCVFLTIDRIHRYSCFIRSHSLGLKQGLTLHPVYFRIADCYNGSLSVKLSDSMCEIKLLWCFLLVAHNGCSAQCGTTCFRNKWVSKIQSHVDKGWNTGYVQGFQDI